MNRYTLSITTKFKNEDDVWGFIIIAEDSKEFVKEVIEENKDMYKSVVDLMDYICDTYGWKWEDFEHDIEIKMN